LADFREVDAESRVGNGDPAATLVQRMAADHETHRLAMTPFDHIEAFELCQLLLGNRPSPGLVDDVLAGTAGNVGAIVRTIQSGQRLGGFGVGPDGVIGLQPIARFSEFSVHGDALDGLSSNARLLARHVACLGSEGRIDDLRVLLNAAEVDIDLVLDELVTARLLDEDGSRYWFVDPRLRDRIYADLPIRTRQQLHAAIARQLHAHHTGEPSMRLEAIFHHARTAADKADPLLLVRVAAEVATTAEASRRYALAAVALETILERADLDDRARLTVLVRCGNAHYLNSATQSACQRLDEAVGLAMALNDDATAGTAMLSSLTVRQQADLPVATWEREHPDEPLTKGWYLAALANRRFAAGDVDGGMKLCDEADRVAAPLANPDLDVRIALARGLHHLLDLDPHPADRQFERMSERAKHSIDALTQSWPLSRRALTVWMLGDDDKALKRCDEAVSTCERGRYWGEGTLAHAVMSMALGSSGDVEGCERASRRSVTLQRRSAYAFGLNMSMPMLAGIAASAGDADVARFALAEWKAAGYRVPVALHSLINVMLGGAAPGWRPRSSYDLDIFRAWRPIVDVELADWLQDTGAAATPLSALMTLHDRGVVNCPSAFVTVPRSLAVALYADGQLDDARRVATAERDRATSAGARLAEALCGFDLARWQSDDEAALIGLIEAVGRFEELGLAAWTARCQREIDGRPAAARLLGEHATRELATVGS
jgi:hypothetical protein